MITTIHARPDLHAAVRGFTPNKAVLCPRCFKTVGAARDARETQQMLSLHRCPIAVRDMLQPSTAVPFS